MSSLRFALVLAIAFLPPFAAFGQLGSPSCIVTAVPTVVRSEGVAERLGDIVLSCTGTPGREVTGSLTIFINTTVTNRITTDSGSLDVQLTVNNALSPARATLAGSNQVAFNALTFTFSSAGTAELRISNIRGDASFGGASPGFGGGTFFPGQAIIAQLAFNPAGLINFTRTQFEVGTPQRGLYATSTSRTVPSQIGSPLPESVTFSGFIQRGTSFFSTRVTEGFVSAFLPRQPQESTGTRIALRFSNVPSDARLFVPAAIAGSNAAVPTGTGEFGGSATGGRYVTGSQTLFLGRVQSTDAQGNGGFASGISSTDGTIETMTEVTLANGSGIAVFEVLDSNPLTLESAQIPVFIGVPPTVSARNVVAQLQVLFAPISQTATTSAIAPVPRFINSGATSDCGTFQDCGVFVPTLFAQPILGTFRLTQGVGIEERRIVIENRGGGVLAWSAFVEYKNASDWILLDVQSGTGPRTIRMYVKALTEMPPGVYEATVTIDAGSAGVARYPIRLDVVAAQTSPPPPVVDTRPAVTAIVHGATFETGDVARGSLVTLRGRNFGAANVAVTFDGKAARALYTSAEQINVLVPEDLPGNTAQTIVTVNGTASAPVTVNVVAANPGIFTPGILNEDNTVNSPSNPAAAGSTVQIYATGLLPPDGRGNVDVRLHDIGSARRPFAGNAPGLPGVQQVNVFIPEYFPTMTTEVSLCTDAGGQRRCSAPVKIHLRAAQ